MASKINISRKFQFNFSFLFAVLLLLSLRVSAQHEDNHANAQENHHQDTLTGTRPGVMHLGTHSNADSDIDITKVAFEHILDSHSWHLWGDGHDAVSIPLPVILKGRNGWAVFMSSEFHHDYHATQVVEKNGDRFVNFEEKIYFASDVPNANGQYLENSTNEKGDIEVLNAVPLDLSITKNVAQMFLSVLILLLIFTSIAKSYKKYGVTTAPKGKQSFFEPLILFVRDDIARNNIGPRSDKFVPYLLTVFFLILINNVLGLVPIGANLTGNIAFTLTLSVCTLIITNINGNSHYWHHLFAPPAPKWLYPILVPIELVGILTKPFALMIRLFANITAGHIIVISLIGLIFVFKTLAIAPVSIAFALFIDVLECLVAFLQAYIFTMLTALFIGSAVGDTNEDGAHTEDDEKLAPARH